MNTITAEWYVETEESKCLLVFEIPQVPRIGEFVYINWCDKEELWGNVKDIVWVYSFDETEDDIIAKHRVKVVID